MTREQKYPDTETFVFFNRNPHNRYTSDCVVRAISTALNIPYNTVVMELAELQCRTGFDMSEKVAYNRYLNEKGWVMHKQPRKADGTKYTGKEFCRAMNYCELEIKNDDKIIAHIGGHHIVAIMDWQVWDTWDSTDGCIGNYWTKA